MQPLLVLPVSIILLLYSKILRTASSIASGVINYKCRKRILANKSILLLILVHVTPVWALLAKTHNNTLKILTNKHLKKHVPLETKGITLGFLILNKLLTVILTLSANVIEIITTWQLLVYQFIIIFYTTVGKCLRPPSFCNYFLLCSTILILQLYFLLEVACHRYVLTLIPVLK